MLVSLVFIIASVASLSLCRAERLCASDNHKNGLIVIGFYGISRALEVILPTLQKHVVDVLDDAEIGYEVLWSTNAAFETVKTRGQLRKSNILYQEGIDPYEVRLLEPCQVSLIDQDKVRHEEYLHFAKTRGLELDENFQFVNKTKAAELDHFHDKLRSIQNMLCAFHSMNILAGMVEARQAVHNISYDAMLILRPDTAMVRDIDLPQYMKKIKNEPKAIWIPNFQHYHGLNDRAAFGSIETMMIYLKRGQAYREAPGLFPVSEILVNHTLVLHNITVYNSTMRVMRVRQDGTVAENKERMRISEKEWNRCVTVHEQEGHRQPLQIFNVDC